MTLNEMKKYLISCGYKIKNEKAYIKNDLYYKNPFDIIGVYLITTLPLPKYKINLEFDENLFK